LGNQLEVEHELGYRNFLDDELGGAIALALVVVIGLALVVEIGLVLAVEVGLALVVAISLQKCSSSSLTSN